MHMSPWNRTNLGLIAVALLFTAETWAAPVVIYSLNETSGTVAVDSSGAANTGAYTGNPTLGAAAVRQTGIYVAADSQFVYAPASATLNSLGAANADFTVAFWVRPNGMTGGWRVLLHKGASSSERGPGIWLNPGNNRIHFRVSTTANYNEGTDSATNLPDNTWSHVACVKAANKWRCYVNGVLDTEFTLSGTTIGNNSPLYVGDDPWYSGCQAWFDDVRVYDTALSEAQIKSLMGIAGRWKLDEVSGTIASDASGIGNNGTYTNGPTLNQAGADGAAVSFDGTDDYVGMPDAASLKATDSITLAAWVHPTASTSPDRMIVNKEGEYEIALTDTNAIKWAIANTSPGWVWHQTAAVAPNDTWSHIVLVYDGSQVQTYLNGSLVSTVAASGAIGDAHPALNELWIGGRSNNPSGKYFGGRIDDVHLYTRALTAAEVKRLYGLVGHWKFAEGTGTTAADSSGLASAASLSGGATWTADCLGNGGLQTNGSGGVAQTASIFTPPAQGTVAFWMRSTGAPAGTARIMGLGGDWEIRQINDGRVISDLCGDGGTTIGSITPLTGVGQWYHFAATFDAANDTYAIYVDGKLETSGTNPIAMNQQAAAVLSFGTRTGSAEYWQVRCAMSASTVDGYMPLKLPSCMDSLVTGKWMKRAASSPPIPSALAVMVTVVGTVNWIPAAVDNGLQLDGSTRMEVNSVMGSPKNVSLAAWARLTAADSGGAEVVSLGDYFGIRLNETATMSRAFFYNGSTWVSVPTNQSFTGTGWHHFAAVFNDDQNYCKFYVDGAEAASVSTTVTIPYTGLGTKTVVGAHGNGGTIWDLLGRVDDVRIYNRALCPAEIQALRNGADPFEGVQIIKWVEIQ